MPPSFSGVIVPTVTPFDESGGLDLAANERLLNRLIEGGVNGLFVLGTTGEAQHLSVEERKQVMRHSAEVTAKRIPLIAGVGDTSTATTLELTKAAEDAGADGVAVIGPYFWTPGDDHLYMHFRAVAEATRLPVLLYNFPAFVGANLSIRLVKRLAEECPNIVGIKESLDSGTHMRRMVNHVKPVKDDFTVLCGHDDLALFALSAGADGMVSSTSNFAPETFTRLYGSYRSGDWEAAKAASATVGRLVEAYDTDPCGAAVVKAALSLRGWLDNPAPRPPALPLDAEKIAIIKSLLLEAGLIEG